MYIYINIGTYNTYLPTYLLGGSGLAHTPVAARSNAKYQTIAPPPLYAFTAVEETCGDIAVCVTMTTVSRVSHPNRPKTVFLPLPEDDGLCFRSWGMVSSAANDWRKLRLQAVVTRLYRCSRSDCVENGGSDFGPKNDSLDYNLFYWANYMLFRINFTQLYHQNRIGACAFTCGVPSFTVFTFFFSDRFCRRTRFTVT